MNTKFTGYLCFYLGLAIIIGSSISALLVFSGKTPPIKTFDLPPIVLDSQTLKFLGYQYAATEGGIEILPSTVNNQFANFFAHLIIMSFFAGIGYRVSLLGAYFLRPINIQVKETLKEVSAF